MFLTKPMATPVLYNSDAEKDTVREKVRDSLFDGELACWQYKRGYRFSIDSVLLAHFTPVRNNSTILDLGTGCGVLGLILLYRYKNKGIRITGIEKQPDLVDLAHLNIKSNNFTDTFQLVPGDIADIKKLLKAESFSVVISNPPFYSLTSGRLSSEAEPLIARHQEDSGLDGFVGGAAYCLKNRGRVVFIYPARLLSELFKSMKDSNLEPKIMQFIYSYPDEVRGARLVLVEGMKNGGSGLIVLPPFYIYQYKNGPYTEDVASMYEPDMTGF